MYKKTHMQIHKKGEKSKISFPVFWRRSWNSAKIRLKGREFGFRLRFSIRLRFCVFRYKVCVFVQFVVVIRFYCRYLSSQRDNSYSYRRRIFFLIFCRTTEIACGSSVAKIGFKNRFRFRWRIWSITWIHADSRPSICSSISNWIFTFLFRV